MLRSNRGLSTSRALIRHVALPISNRSSPLSLPSFTSCCIHDSLNRVSKMLRHPCAPPPKTPVPQTEIIHWTLPTLSSTALESTFPFGSLISTLYTSHHSLTSPTAAQTDCTHPPLLFSDFHRKLPCLDTSHPRLDFQREAFWVRK